MPSVIQESKVFEVAVLSPEEAQKQSDDMFYRNSKAAWKPRKVRRFKVSSPRVRGGAEGIYSAVNDLEAWALHCDAMGQHPGGWRKHQGKIEALGEAAEAPPEAPMPAVPQPKPKQPAKA